MKLYDTPLAPNPRRVRYFLAEKGIQDLEIVPINLMAGDQKTPEYLAKAGLANVPMLELDDGTCITESLAICRYLESLHPEPNLFGRTPIETAEIEMWTRRAEMLVATPLMHAVRHLNPRMAALETQVQVVGERNLEDGLRALKVLDGQLAKSAWLAADRLTIADIVGFSSIDFGRLIKLEIPGELTHVVRWLAAMRERPAAQAGMVRSAT
jgi:glutathione S-transferase